MKKRDVMRRDLSLVRKLEKIEKEMGYCEIKIEKGQRLCAQLQFLKLHRQALSGAIRKLEVRGNPEVGDGNLLGGRALRSVFHQVSLDPESEESVSLRELFRAVGAFPLLLEERDNIDRDIGDIEDKIDSFDAFLDKRRGLNHERDETLHTFALQKSDPIHQISEEFERTEQNWNVLTEDLMNIDEAIFCVSRAADYLCSARNFILTSRSQFAVESWLRDGYLIDLFKHSTVGRAKEMVEGADRNLRRALVELICLEELVINPEDFEHLLVPFLDTLFHDLFQFGKLVGSLKILEKRSQRLDGFKQALVEKREGILSRQNLHERNREKLFHEIGDARRKLTVAAQ
jgi:hypothetical protein